MLNNLVLQRLDISTRKGALAAIEDLDRTIEYISAAQAKLRAIENRFIYNLNNLSEAVRHSATAYGRIIDTDSAKASTALARQKILQQASSDILVKANDNQRLVL
ncbi:MAG: flagellin [Candidatus Puniceispirillaceae bacterium]